MRGDGWGEGILEAFRTKPKAFGKQWDVGKVREVIIMAPRLKEVTLLVVVFVRGRRPSGGKHRWMGVSLQLCFLCQTWVTQGDPSISLPPLLVDF